LGCNGLLRPLVLLQETGDAPPDTAGAAVLWISYGLLIHAMPVVAANVIVAVAALYSTFAGGARKNESAA